MRGTHREIDPESGLFKRNLDCDYIFRIDLALNGIPFGIKLFGKVQL